MKFLFFILFFSFNGLASDAPSEEKPYVKDVKETFSLAIEASYKQFMAPSFPYSAGVGSLALWWSFEEDDRLIARYGKKRKNTFLEVLDASGTIANFNLIPLTFYFIGVNQQNKKYVHYAQDSLAAWMLVSVETVGLSFVNIHERPIGKDSEEISVWEESFRGDSSFPSGHVTPVYILALQTYQYFGLKASIVPILFSMGISYERVQSQKHYVSDVVGSMILAYWAVEGVKKTRSDKKESKLSWFILPTEKQVSLNLQYQF